MPDANVMQQNECTSKKIPQVERTKTTMTSLFTYLYLLATMDTAFAMYAQQVANLNYTTSTWHCEACPNTVAKRASMYSLI